MTWGQCAEILTRSWGKRVGVGLRELLGNTVLAHDSQCDPVVPVLENPSERMNLSTLNLPLPAPSSHFLQVRQKIENKGSFPSEKNSSNNKWTWRMLSLVVLDSRGTSGDRVTCTAAETKRKNPVRWASSPCLLLEITKLKAQFRRHHSAVPDFSWVVETQ